MNAFGCQTINWTTYIKYNMHNIYHKIYLYKYIQIKFLEIYLATYIVRQVSGAPCPTSRQDVNV